MANLKFADTHNMVAFLSKPKESDGFEQIVDFLNAHPIKYALTVNPTIYISCIEHFWSIVKAKTINREVQLHALVDGKKIIITESTVRRDLQLVDAEGVDCLPNSTIFEQLTLMGVQDGWAVAIPQQGLTKAAPASERSSKFRYSETVGVSAARRVARTQKTPRHNEDAKMDTGKPRTNMRADERTKICPRSMRRQKVDAFTRRISDFSEDKKRRMPANVKTYDRIGDPDDHLKIFESAATIENWPQPVSIDGFEELPRAFRLNFTQRKKYAKNPVELARVKQRHGSPTSPT
ncbi:hypothetical protein Tco_1114075 [Tanacetum coccineum]|uniref:Xylulose kinase-1 n=1 Tax=Tanacetum coccineum TaxID=301880 RepID=A0ABQ5IWB2_9ASTR